MFDKMYFKYWLEKFHHIKTKDDWMKLTLEKQCELIAEFSDDAIMEMDDL
jgi:hypothetical protein